MTFSIYIDSNILAFELKKYTKRKIVMSEFLVLFKLNFRLQGCFSLKPLELAKLIKQGK